MITMVAIAAERYFAVIYPAGNVGKVTKRKLKVRGLQSSIIPNYLRVFFYPFGFTQTRTTLALMKRIISKMLSLFFTVK